jgi:putative OPT family oligopeptide transporter
MAETPKKTDSGEVQAMKPYVPATVTDMPEITWSAVLTGAILGIIFAASSMYLVLKVGMTVSASIPIAVLSVSLFRGISAFTRIPLWPSFLRLRRATILENNMVQTTGSAGESIAFGVGVTMPALMLLGFEMDLLRVMTVAVLGGLLGILMMIPLRRAFIVRQHSELPYPEGTACADVLKAGEKGGTSAAMVFLGFTVASIVKFLMNPLHIIKDHANLKLFTGGGDRPVVGLNRGVLGGEFTPELLGVGFVIGPRIASITVAGGVMAYLAILPTIAMFGDQVPVPIFPSESKLIRDMDETDIRNFYVLYIGAGAVATGGIISMGRALPVIFGSLIAGFKDLAGSFRRREPGELDAVPRTERDLSMGVVLVGSTLLILLLALSPNLGLGFSLQGLLGALLVVIFGFLFVTVSARLTGEIGSSSNPISGMTVATLLLTCLIFLALGKTSKADTLTALTIAAVVCISASNGGTTAQDLKTGFLVGATPKYQQIGILIGALTSALVIGATVKLVNDAGTHYTKNPDYLPTYVLPADQLSTLTAKQRVGRPYAEDDSATYRVLYAAQGEIPEVPQGKYLVDDQGTIRYREDPAINGLLPYDDKQAQVKVREEQGEPVKAIALPRYDAPKTKLMALIIDGILNQKLPWSLVLIGALLAISLELCGVPSLPFAVGIYLPIQVSFPIFLGGLMRWIVEKINPPEREESDSSPGVLLCSGYIAGGSLVGVLAAFLNFRDDWVAKLNFSQPAGRLFIQLAERLDLPKSVGIMMNEYSVMAVFGVMYVLLFFVGIWGRWSRKAKVNTPDKGKQQDKESAGQRKR